MNLYKIRHSLKGECLYCFVKSGSYHKEHCIYSVLNDLLEDFITLQLSHPEEKSWFKAKMKIIRDYAKEFYKRYEIYN